MKRIQLQPAYILHRRPYRETSFILDVFTKEHGRVSLIARGVRKSKSTAPGILQPFIPLLISFSGSSELMSLIHAETHGNIMHLQGACLFTGFYLNELLIVLMQKWDAHPVIFERYEEILNHLNLQKLDEKKLRLFEKYLLEELGYGLFPKYDVASQTIAAEKHYSFIPDHGFMVSSLGNDSQAKTTIFKGKSLLDYANCDWQDLESLRDAKRLIRLVLMPLLGTRTIHSRRLFED